MPFRSRKRAVQPSQPVETDAINQNNKMRNARSRPHSRPQSQHGLALTAVRVPPLTSRKVFNCIVDESALVAGVKRSTRNGIRQWVKNGQIRLFVPLYALDRLSVQKNASTRHGEDVRETLQWLDEATSKYPNIVKLQGAEETFESWSDAEKFAVPRSLFSESDGFEDHSAEHELEPDQDSINEEELPTDNVRKLTLADLAHEENVSSAGSMNSRAASPSSGRSLPTNASIASPPTSPAKPASSPVKSATVRPTSSSCNTVPPTLQPLFNHILWRIHQKVDLDTALESFLFLCNDQSKVHYAKGFEIKTKRLEQLREAIIREDKDFKNRELLLSKEAIVEGSVALDPVPTSPGPSLSAGDDAEVVFRSPPRAPAAMVVQQQQQTNVIDPDAFGRNIATIPVSPRQQDVTLSPGRGGQPLSLATRGNFRGQSRGSSRGNGSSPRGRGSIGGTGRGVLALPNNRPDVAAPGGQIDPNSFARPRGTGNTGRGGRKLWVPT